MSNEAKNDLLNVCPESAERIGYSPTSGMCIACESPHKSMCKVLYSARMELSAGPEDEGPLACHKCGWNVPRVAKEVTQNGDTEYRIVCDGCGHKGELHEEAADAIKEWNDEMSQSGPSHFSRVVSDRFSYRHRFRHVCKCCGNCRFGNLQWEGEVECEHPELDYSDEAGNLRHSDVGAMIDCVCDLWEPPRQTSKE